MDRPDNNIFLDEADIDGDSDVFVFLTHDVNYKLYVLYFWEEVVVASCGVGLHVVFWYFAGEGG